MKQRITLTLLGISILLGSIACKETEMYVSAPVEQMIESKSADEPMRSFDSKEDFYAEIREVASMSPADFDKWLESQGDFVSQWSFMDVINAEMAPVKSWEEALVVMKKYEGMYIFNPNESDLDGEPYCPVSNNAYSYVLNKYGDARIAGEVVNFNDLNTFDDIVKGNPMTRAWTYDNKAVNGVQHQAGRARYQVSSKMVSYGMNGRRHQLLFRHQYKNFLVFIGGPTRWHLKYDYYRLSGYPTNTDLSPGWESFRRRSGTTRDIAEADGGGLYVEAKIWFMTTSLQEAKPMIISHTVFDSL